METAASKTHVQLQACFHTISFLLRENKGQNFPLPGLLGKKRPNVALSSGNVSRRGDTYSCTEVLPSDCDVGNYVSEDLGGESVRYEGWCIRSEASLRQALWLRVIPRKHAELALVGGPEHSPI